MITTLHLSAGEPDALNQALQIIAAGGLVAFPTDTVYGLGAKAFDQEAVESIYTAKDRPVEKAIPVLISAMSEIDQVVARVPPMAQRLAEHFWPGPLTLIFPKKDSLPEAVSATPGVAVRVPDHPLARKLLGLTGPLAVTSANISGEQNPVTAQEVARQLDGQIELILDGGQTTGGIPSTLVDCLGSEPLVLRPGPVSREMLLQVLSRD